MKSPIENINETLKAQGFTDWTYSPRTLTHANGHVINLTPKATFKSLYVAISLYHASEAKSLSN